MFPNSNDAPAKLAQLSDVSHVSSTVPVYLLLPVRSHLRFPQWEPPAVPEIPVDEYDNFGSHKHDVWTSRQRPYILPEAQPAAVQKTPQGDLGHCIHRPNPRHRPASLRRCRIVRHDCMPPRYRALLDTCYKVPTVVKRIAHFEIYGGDIQEGPDAGLQAATVASTGQSPLAGTSPVER